MQDSWMYVYKEYGYRPEIEEMEDNRKIYHEVYSLHDNGDIYSNSIPLSPYSHPGLQLFKNWIDMGQPTREQLGGQQKEDHERYYQKWITFQLEKELDL